MDAAAWVTIVTIITVIGVDALLFGRDKRTVSEVIWAATRRSPLVPFLFGMLMGHFFWCPCEFK